MKVILGSQSPRRRALLAGLDIPFETVNIDADESYPMTLQQGEIPLYIARAKARAYARELHADEVLITADTIVWVDGQMIGKPTDEAQAEQMLRLLSGKTHQVFTAVVFSRGTDHGTQEADAFIDRTDVTFRTLSEEEISYYVSRYRPLDKAGAYGVQEFIGYIGVTRLEGSYFNVMGFPVERVWERLSAWGVNPSSFVSGHLGE